MISKKNTTSTPDDALVPMATVFKAATSIIHHSLDARYTVLNLSSQDPNTILVAVPRNNPIPDATNTPVEPTESFKNHRLHFP